MDNFRVDSMADWNALLKEQANDLISLYASCNNSQLKMIDSHDSSSSSQSQSWFPPTPGHSDTDHPFCTQDNLQSSLSFLDQELQVIGFASLTLEAGVPVSTVALVNRLYDMLRLYQRSNRIQEELENRLHRCNSERDHYVSNNTKLKRDFDSLDKNLAKQEERYRQLSIKHKSLVAKHKADKEEVKRLQSVLVQKEAHTRHELRKQEKEAVKLKERLHHMLSDKNPARKVGMSIMNALQRADGQRATWQNSGYRKEEEMYELVIDNFEKKQKELMVENNDLRQCVMNMHIQLASFLDRTSKHRPSPSVHETSQQTNLSLSSSSEDEEIDDVTSMLSSRMTIDDLELSDGHYQMPYDIVRTDLDKQFKTVCKQIKKKMNKSEDITPGHMTARQASPAVSKLETAQTEEELAKVTSQLSQYKLIIKQQEELIQSVEKSFLHESQLLDDKETLSEQKKLFYQERAKLEEEQVKLREAAVKLGRDRQAFQSERSNILLKQFFNITPFREPIQPLSKKDGARLLPATPLFSPAPVKKMQCPSTADLYRTLGFTPQVRGGDGTTVRKAASTESLRTSASRRSIGSSHSSPASLPLPLASAESRDTIRVKLFPQANSTAKDIDSL